jgi:hypothetical protein
MIINFNICLPVLMQELVMKVNKMERSYHRLALIFVFPFIWTYLAGDLLQEKVQRWLSAADPWTNHNIARKAHHHGTATWFTQGDVFGKWKSTGCLLWIHGLRT